MKTSDLRNEVHGYVEQADDKVLEAIKTLVKPSIEQYQLSEEQIKELRKRKKGHEAGLTESYTWEEVKKRLKAKRK
ncbi:MAG: hypothetical protein JSS76_07185 [Bacteroidetes bacterium]|nr:hypothetical protein [Bacteroidota bacterium]